MNQNRSRDQTRRGLSQERVIYSRSTANSELRENARDIFWSGTLAFHEPKIIFFYMVKTKNSSSKIALVFYVHSYTPDVMVV